MQPIHIELSKKGIKTETRRRWGMNRIKSPYQPLMRDYRHKHEPEDGYAKVLEVTRQALKHMNERDAKAEGGYKLSQYKDVWISINGKWNPEEVVFVVRYEWVRDKP